MPTEKTQPFCPCSRVLNWTGKGLMKADWHCTWHKDAVASCDTASPDAHMQLAHNSNTHFWHLATLSTAQQIAVSASHSEVLVVIK